MRTSEQPPVGTEAPLASARRFSLQRRWVWWVALGAATVCLAVFLRSFDLRAAARELATANLGWVALAVAANFLTLPLMTHQWVLFLPRGVRMRWSAMWECVTLSMASMNTLPFGGGHAVAVGLLAARGVTVPGGVSILALEQICEGVGKVVLLMVALATAPLPPVLQQAMWWIAAAVVLGFIPMLWLAYHPPSGLPTGHWRVKWGRHLEVLRRPRTFLVTAALSVVIKATQLLAVYAVQRSLGVPLPLSSTPLVLAAVTFATMMSVAPGNVGLYELAGIAAYRLLNVPAHQAAALALLLHATFLVPMIGTGYGLTLWRAMRPAKSPSVDPRE